MELNEAIQLCYEADDLYNQWFFERESIRPTGDCRPFPKPSEHKSLRVCLAHIKTRLRQVEELRAEINFIRKSSEDIPDQIKTAMSNIRSFRKEVLSAISINGRKVTTSLSRMNYESLKIVAGKYAQVPCEITYSGAANGTLLPNQLIDLKDGMVFTVTPKAGSRKKR